MYKNKGIVSFFSVVSLAFSHPLFASEIDDSPPPTIKVTINNNSGEELYCDVVSSEKLQVYNFQSGQLVGNLEQGCIKTLRKGANTIDFPLQIISGGGRIYISTDPFTSKMSSVPGQPDLATYEYVYDKIEVGYHPQRSAGWNTTSVDFFGIPMQVEFTQGSKNTVGFVHGVTRTSVQSKLTSNLKEQPSIYDDKFFVKGKDDQVVRIFSPQHFYTTLKSEDWQAFINDSLSKMVQSFPAEGYTYGTYTYKNPAFSQGVLTVQETSSDTSVQLSNITPGNAVAGVISYEPQNSAAANFAGMISATINRGVLADPSHWGENGGGNLPSPKYYYPGYPENLQNIVYNLYAASLISYGVGGKLYADSYDDFWHNDSSLQVTDSNYQNGITINVLPF